MLRSPENCIMSSRGCGVGERRGGVLVHQAQRWGSGDHQHADHAPGSIAASIGQLLMMRDTKERRMRENREQNTLIGAFKMKAGLEAVRRTGGEKKRRERFRQTLQTGTLPGVFQEMYLNVFC